MEEQINHKNNKSAVKHLLENGEVLSVKTAWIILSTTELRKYVADLRKDGLKIISDWRVNANNQRYKEYWLERKANEAV